MAAAPAETPAAPAVGLAQVRRRPWQRYLAEFLGTFALVFAGCGAVISNGMAGGAVTHVGVAASFGLVVAVMIYALGPISAAHFNPAVTLGFAAARRFPWRHVPAYWTAQAAGALFASLLHKLLYGAVTAGAVGYGATLPVIGTGATLGLEIVLTFFVMLVIVAVATDRRVPGTVPGLAVGGVVGLCALFGGPATGASMNPARSMAPALFSGGPALDSLWIYIVAPAVGAVLAALCYELLRDGSLHAQSAPADLDEAMHAEPGLSRS